MQNAPLLASCLPIPKSDGPNPNDPFPHFFFPFFFYEEEEATSERGSDDLG